MVDDLTSPPSKLGLKKVRNLVNAIIHSSLLLSSKEKGKNSALQLRSNLIPTHNAFTKSIVLNGQFSTIKKHFSLAMMIVLHANEDHRPQMQICLGDGHVR